MRRLIAFFLMCCGIAAAYPVLATSEIEERILISDASKNAFLRADFARLEQMASEYRKTKSRTSSGLWKLTWFYAGIDVAISTLAEAKGYEEACRQLEGTTARWAQQYRSSPGPYIALGMVHIAHAWAYRGDGYAYTVKPEAWAPFRKYIALARQTLEAHKSAAAADPRWYETMLTVALAEGWRQAAFDSLLNEALDREPLFYQTYFQALEYLLPKWHGSVPEIERFAREAVRRTAKQEGQGQYARIYWYASQTQYGNKLFTESFATWQTMKAGFEDITARYPDAWNLNNYAKFACLARDREKTRELLQRMGPAIDEAWTPQFLLQRCSDWAWRI